MSFPPAARSGRRGIALAAAIGGLVVIGVLIVGVFFSASQEYRVGANTITQERAFRAAEFGLNATLAAWDNTAMAAVPIGGTKTFVYDSSARGWIDTVVATRLGLHGYQLVSTGTAGGGLGGIARRRTAVNVRMNVIQFQAPGAITVRGAAKIGGSAVLTGADTNPWADCPPPGLPAQDLSLPPLAPVEYSGCGPPLYKCLASGVPPLPNPLAADTATYSNFGDETYASLTSLATKVFTGGGNIGSPAPATTASGTCNTSLVSNWGGPTGGACAGYRPVIWLRGAESSYTLSGGMGQGILLVDGDLSVSGGFSFYGPTIVRGKLSMAGGGAKSEFYGTTLVANLNNSGTSDITGNVNFKWSTCANNRAGFSASLPRRLRQRAWLEMY